MGMPSASIDAYASSSAIDQSITFVLGSSKILALLSFMRLILLLTVKPSGDCVRALFNSINFFSSTDVAIFLAAPLGGCSGTCSSGKSSGPIDSNSLLNSLEYLSTRLSASSSLSIPCSFNLSANNFLTVGCSLIFLYIIG